ncbi:hypothetical protein [Parasitella parasitica]|uniref:CCHC-type domain-containing protein n=1 Tax=Parasitella parasitica TaxID=35722 RepID=A0A0B7NEW4_9FUNG|nr:hypothetical protein [Parasitella parasitica]
MAGGQTPISERLQYAISCHQSGHIRSGCPQLVKRRCFGCDQPGHIVRFCPEAKQTVVLDLEEVDEQTETEAVGQEETVDEIPSGSESEENPLDEVLNSGEEMACANNNEEDEVQLACAATQGSMYSKFAPDSESSSMKVDPPTKKVNTPLERSLSSLARERQALYDKKKRETDERNARLLQCWETRY